MEQLDANDLRRSIARFQPEALAHNLQLVERLEGIAAQKGCQLSQLALAWLLAQGEDIIPIPGTRQRSHLDENLGALAVTLTDEDLAQMNDIMPIGAAVGER